MPYNGSGTYAAPALPGTWNPASSGGTIDPTDWNTLLADFVLAYSTAICKDGQTVVTANIPMASHKFTGLSAGSGAGDSVRFEQVLPPGGTTLATLHRGYLSGAAISRASATTIGVAAGVATDDTFVQIMPIGSVTINCAATGALGLDAGSLANTTWYHVFIIAKTDGTVSALASTSLSSPTYPTGYTLKRRIGSFKTDGSAQIVNFVQDGDLFQWNSPPTADITATNPGTSAVTRTLASVPTGLRLQAIMVALLENGDATSSYLYLSDLSTTDLTPAAGLQELTNSSSSAGAGASDPGGRVTIMTNTAAQIRSRVSYSSATVTFGLRVLGWIDRRGRDD